MEYHTIEPIYNKESKILILGSFPSIKSREAKFYYYHHQNRFWKILGNIFDNDNLSTITLKKQFLLNNKIALWDVIESCEIKGSSDSSIKDVKINDIQKLINESHIHKIYTNGQKAHQLYQKYCLEITQLEDICLPSTSPANATYSLEKLLLSWQIVLQS